jgi:hypothetical protein
MSAGPALLAFSFLLQAAEPSTREPANDIDKAFSRLYNFDFAGAERLLDEHGIRAPADPLTYSVRAACYLFTEMYRLQILQTELFVDDSRIAEKWKLKPDPALRSKLFAALVESRKRAEARLAVDAGDRDALFAMCMSAGVETDYTAFVEGRRWRGLRMARRAHGYARKLLAMDPPFYDAHHTVGMIEYVVGSLPFFVRWFVRFDQIKGDKEAGIRNLKQVANHGRYYRPFAKILLSVIYLREKQPAQAEGLLAELARDFPENPLIRRELQKVRRQLGSR